MTKVTHVALMLSTALFLLTACQPAEPSDTAAGQAPATPAQSASSAIFINAAGTSGIEEVKFAQVAATKATDPGLRSFAERIIADFNPIDQRLAALAESKGLTPASDMDGRHQMLYQQFLSLSGTAFDRAYVDGQLQDLTTATEVFQTEADSGSDQQVRGFAKQYLPMVLEDVRTISAIASP